MIRESGKDRGSGDTGKRSGETINPSTLPASSDQDNTSEHKSLAVDVFKQSGGLIMAKNASSRDLDGQVALVTGSAQGLGLGIAEELGRRGASVVLGDLQHDKAATEADRLRRQGLAAEAVRLDIGDS